MIEIAINLRIDVFLRKIFDSQKHFQLLECYKIVYFAPILFNRVPLSSTPPQFNTSVQHKRATPFQPPKSLSSPPKTPQFTTKTPIIALYKRAF